MKNGKIYKDYKSKAQASHDELMRDYQLCKAYLNFNGGITQMVEKIISERYGELTKTEIAKVRDSQGNSNHVIELPNRDFKMTPAEVLSGFVELRFDKMVAEVEARKSGYPQMFRDIVEKHLS